MGNILQASQLVCGWGRSGAILTHVSVHLVAHIFSHCTILTPLRL